jgi:hypothetical protein
MRVYKCDSCGITIEKPYEEEMKEFCFVAEIDEYGILPKPLKRKVKIHLCEDCFEGLYIIKKRKDIEETQARKESVRKKRQTMNNFKFNLLGFLAMALIVTPIPFALAWGYKAIPIAIVCIAVVLVIIKNLLKGGGTE